MLVEHMAQLPIDARPRSGDGCPCASAAQPRVRLFQIAYDEKTLSQVDDGFELLDNLENARPDWFEYWPIRKYLMSQALDEETLYGFFSPKFRHKTGLGHVEVVEFVRQRAAVADVFLFSPQPGMASHQRGPVRDLRRIGERSEGLALPAHQLPRRGAAESLHPGTGRLADADH